jgi:hypothetical protein
MLKKISIWDIAKEEYENEVQSYADIRDHTPANSRQHLKAKGALAFLHYFRSYMSDRDYWLSWSLGGAMEAAARMGVLVAIIARTTNHLESFNGRIKLKYFLPYMHSGRLPRIDYWILILITRVLPDFFEEWLERRATLSYEALMQHAHPGEHGVPPARKLMPRKFRTSTEVEAATRSWATSAATATQHIAHPVVQAALRKELMDKMSALEVEMLAELDHEEEDMRDMENIADDGPMGDESNGELPVCAVRTIKLTSQQDVLNVTKKPGLVLPPWTFPKPMESRSRLKVT